ncbi:MAG: hypothetical protein CVU88_01880 [Firmicutes bacterium HGW-Firmicutes-13]|nr:MAG: hypothetical protein CVU88_01880 [Firmicutes bacterium HGW-Firmicutes-13]
MSDDKKETSKKEQVVSIKKDAFYYLNKGTSFFHRKEYHKAVKYFKKALENRPHDIVIHYKIAYVLNEISSSDYSAVIEKLFHGDLPEFSFFAGIYYCMEGDLTKSEIYLEYYIEISHPDSILIPEAHKLLDTMHDAVLFQKNLDYVKLSYKYAGITEIIKERLKEKFESLFVRVKMKENLYQYDDDLTANVIFLYGLLEKDERAEKVLRQFIKSSWAKENQIELALLALKKIGAEEPYTVLIDGNLVEVTLKSYMEKNEGLDQLGRDWNDVLKYTLDNMKSSGKYSDTSCTEVKTLWTIFLQTSYPDVPEIDDKMAWAAGLEYTFLKMKSIKVSSKRLAMIYKVSNFIIITKSNIISNTLRI